MATSLHHYSSTPLPNIRFLRQMYQALRFIQMDSQIHRLDKKALIVDYVRYAIKRDPWGKESVIRYFEQRYTYNCARYLDLVFGPNNWEHVIVDGSINYEGPLEEEDN